VALVAVALVVVFWKFSANLPTTEFIATEVRSPVPTTIYSQDNVLLGKLEVENRQPIMLDKVPKNLINATIAIEDHRFYEHPGIDIQGIARAAVANLRGSSLRQGASTLTQQLVRQPGLGAQLGLTSEKRFSRKFREALIALRVEQLYAKNEILQLYLNNIYYGAGAYGIQAASKTYFGKSAYKLSLGEAALLAGLPQRPSRFTPFEHRKAALARRDEVLDAMRLYGYITPDDYEKAKAEKLRLMPPRKRNNFDFRAPYFTTYVLKDLMRRYGADYVYHGLKIETTLNWKMQEAAEKALEEGLEHASGRRANQGAIVSIDNRTGYIRAMVGGRNFHADQFNAVTQGRRQPGSTFKLFDYTAALDTEECTLSSTFPDADFEYPDDPKHRVVGGGDGQSMDIRSAIKWSKNSIAVRVADRVGIKTIIEYAHKMGITTHLDPVLPTALGASAVRPLDLCSAYSIISMGGSRCVPMAIVRVTDAEGNVVEEHTPEMQTDIIKASTAGAMNEAFEGVVNGGTGTAARGTEANGIVENAHGKTGTTNDNRDVWFAGYTPELTTVIWVASVHRGKNGTKTYSEMPGAYGGIVCAPIWHDYMIKAVPEQRKFQTLPLVVQAATSPEITSKNGADADKAHSKQRRDKSKRELASDQKDVNNEGPLPEPTDPNADLTSPDSEGRDAEHPPGSLAPIPTAPTDIKPEGATIITPKPATSVRPAEGIAATITPQRTTSSGLVAPPRGGGTVVSRRNDSPIHSTPSTPKLRVSTPSAVHPAAQEVVTVHVCVDSGDVAGKWCQATKTVQVSASARARMHRCRIHRPPPGEAP
jgi:penicillin-binding protein 1A